jgi:hypothetical protein
LSGKKGIFTKNCPDCNIIQTYTYNCSLQNAIKENIPCKKCSYRKRLEYKIPNFLNFYNKGLGDRQLTIELNISRNIVVKLRKYLNLKPNNPPRTKIEKIDDHTAKCSRCKKITPIKEFQFGRKGSEKWYKFSYCNECRRKQLNKNSNKSVKSFLKNRYHHSKARSRRLNIKFEIDFEYFFNLYNIQNGKCFYTDVEMLICTHGKGRFRHSLSIDKIIPEKGYVEGNVVLCTNKMNTCKTDLNLDEIQRWMPEWYDRIIYWFQLNNFEYWN